MSVKDALQSIHSILTEFGCATFALEEFRRAKADSAAAVAPMLRLLHDLVVLRIDGFKHIHVAEAAWKLCPSADCALEFVQLQLNRWGFCTRQFAAMSHANEASSRLLLIAIAWLLADCNIISVYSKFLTQQLQSPSLSSAVHLILSRPLPRSHLFAQSAHCDDDFVFADPKFMDSVSRHSRSAEAHVDKLRQTLQNFARAQTETVQSTVNAALLMHGRIHSTLRTISARQQERTRLADHLHRIQLSPAFPPSVLRTPIPFFSNVSSTPQVPVRHTVATQSRSKPIDDFSTQYCRPLTLSQFEINSLQRSDQVDSAAKSIIDWCTAHQFVERLGQHEEVFWNWMETVIQEHAQSEAQCTELAQSAVSHLESLLSADPGLSPEKLLITVGNSLQQFMNSEPNLHELIHSGVVSEAEAHETLQRSNESVQKFNSLVHSIHSNLLAQQNPSTNAFSLHSNASQQPPDPQQYISNFNILESVSTHIGSLRLPKEFKAHDLHVESFIDMAFDNASSLARLKLDEDQKLIDSIGLPPHVSKR